jgi:Ca2+-binding EF-hand superfamily protein
MKAYKIYDSDNDGYLELENFIDLFKDKAFKNQQKMWKILSYFGFDSELN